jgi:hypothetical protein
MTAENPYIAVVQQYQEVSNRHDIDACVALFTEDGRIEMNGEVYQGIPALRDAHEYDVGSRTQVAFRDFVVAGDVIECTFWNEHELSRVLGTGGTSGKAVFAFRGNKIVSFSILPPDEEERRRVMTIAAPAFQWLRENHPDMVANWSGFDRAAGDALFALAELWRNYRDETKVGSG